MATVANNDLTEGLSGKIGKVLVFKTMRGKTFVSHRARKPDKKKESEAQRNTRATFKQATAWAQNVLLDPEQKAYYQQRAKALKLPNAYTAAITDYMRKPKVVKTQQGDKVNFSIRKPGFSIRQVRITTNENEEGTKPIVSIRQHKVQWFVQYTRGANELFLPALIITDNTKRDITFSELPI